MVLVLETVGRVEYFINAVKRIDGLDWLGDWDEDDVPPDDDFYYEKGDKDKTLQGRLYLIMSNQRGINELLSLWNRWMKNPDKPKFSYGLMKWRDVFKWLKDIRPWGPKDRLLETGLSEDWKERLKIGDEDVQVEIELWYRDKSTERSRAEFDVRKQIAEEQGQILGQACIPDIHYHAILAKLPIGSVENLLKHKVRLVHCDSVMFFRPTGQMMFEIPDDDRSDDELLKGKMYSEPQRDPVVALLDGFPLQNHERLAGRLIVDDADGWEENCLVKDRVHGTAMASLILHGEIDANEPALTRPIYVRPILKPDSTDFVNSSKFEKIPEDVLPVDLLYRSVRRIFEGDGDVPAVAPTVRIINISVADASRPFNRFPSPLARLVDWLSAKYKVLFIVSAGNCKNNIELDVSKKEFEKLKEDSLSLSKEVLKALNNDARFRRLFAPVNALTVGALHTDNSSYLSYPNRYSPIDLLEGKLPEDTVFPSPLNTQGPGFRRAIKPEILLPGGRALYREKLSNTSQNIIFELIQDMSSSPGQQVATPRAGDLKTTSYTRGTSSATALATRSAARLYETILQTLSEEPGGERLDDNHIAVLLKALLVHGASWDGMQEYLTQALTRSEKITALGTSEKSILARLLGYGRVDIEKVLYCTEQRVTLLGWGALFDGRADLYILPLPTSLSGEKTWRRLTITLAWFTPIEPNIQAYRKADLWFEPYNLTQKLSDFEDLLKLKRQQADWRSVRRGTVQHEIFDGDKAVAFRSDAGISIQVNCRADAGKLTERVPYGLAVTLEVAPEINLPIYEEIRTRILTPIEVAPNVEI